MKSIVRSWLLLLCVFQPPFPNLWNLVHRLQCESVALQAERYSCKVSSGLQCTQYQIPKHGHNTCKCDRYQQALQATQSKLHRNKGRLHHREHVQHAKQQNQYTSILPHCNVHAVYSDSQHHASNPHQKHFHFFPQCPSLHEWKNKAIMDWQIFSTRQLQAVEPIYPLVSLTMATVHNQDEGWQQQARADQVLHRKQGQAPRKTLKHTISHTTPSQRPDPKN